MTEMQIPLGQNGAESAGVPSLRRRLFVGTAMVAIAGLFCVLVGIMWSRSYWRVTAVPSSLLVVQGDQGFAGTRIVVDGPALSAPLHGSITESNGYLYRFALPAGNYSVRVEAPDKTYPPSVLRMAENQYALLSLTKLEEQQTGRRHPGGE